MEFKTHQRLRVVGGSRVNSCWQAIEGWRAVVRHAEQAADGIPRFGQRVEVAHLTVFLICSFLPPCKAAAHYTI